MNPANFQNALRNAEHKVSKFLLKTPLGIFPLKEGKNILGKIPNADLSLNLPGISSIEAVVEVHGDSINIFDLGRHGTLSVSGIKSAVVKLAVLGTFQLSQHSFQIIPFEEKHLVPPPLDILKPNATPATVAPSFFGSRSLPAAPLKINEKNKVPYLVYPLSADPKSHYTSYIFEDIDQLYPVFKWDTQKGSLEVITLFKDRVYSVDYIPDQDGTYFLTGYLPKPKAKFLELPYVGKNDKLPFISIQSSRVEVHNPYNMKVIYIEENTAKPVTTSGNSTGTFELRPKEVLQFSDDNITLFLRYVDAVPQNIIPPLFRRDKEFKKYLLMVILGILFILGGLSLYPVKKVDEQDQNLKKLRTIIYRPKFIPKETPLMVSKNDAIAKTEKAKEVIQKSPVQKVETKKTEPVKTAAEEKTPTPPKVVTEKSSGSKTAEKVQVVKKTAQQSPAPKNAATSKPSQDKAIGGKPAPTQTPQATASKTPSPAKGHVDTYKADTHLQNLSSLLAKGGGAQSAVKTQNAAAEGGSGGLTNLATGGTQIGEFKRAEVSKNIGSLTGAATGKVDASKGAEGLVDKKSYYTAGIPSETVVLGSMDPDVIRRILREHIPQFRYCYQKDLDTAGEEFSGVINLNFVIGASGTVTQAAVTGSSEVQATTKNCVVNVLKGIKFPAPMGGGKVEVKQPINFYAK